MNKIVLISILLTGQTFLEAMNSMLSQHDTLLLLAGESKTPVEISRSYALLSRTIKNSLEDARSSQSSEEFITCPLQEVSDEILRVIIGCLGRLFEYQHTKNTDLLTAIKDDLRNLTPVKFCGVARAIEYLDIPDLGASCAEVVHGKLKPGVIDWSSIASLPVSLLSVLLKQEVAALAGITYEDQVGYQASADKDIDDVDSAHSLTGRGQVPVLSARALCRGHTVDVTSVCVTSDNKIVSGSWDKTVRVWDMEGTELAVCRGHGNQVYSLCVTSDNKIVSGSFDRTVRVWDMHGNQLAVCRGHEGEIRSVCVTSDNKIVSGSDDCTVRVWDIEGKELAVCRGHEKEVTSVCVTSDTKIVSCSGDKTLRVWDIEGKELAVCRGHEGFVTSVCVTSDTKIVSGSHDRTVRVWDMQGNELAVCRGHEDTVWSVCVTSDNKIVSGSDDGTVRVWDLRGTEIIVCKGHEWGIPTICVTPDDMIVSCSDDKTIRVWGMQGTQLAVCRGHEKEVSSVCVTSDNKIVSCSNLDITIRVWDVPLLRLVQRIPFLHNLDHAQALWGLLSRSYNKTLSEEDCLKEIKSLMSQEKS